MAIYEFECKSCDSLFTIPNLSAQEADQVYCVECKSRSLKCVGYDQSDTEPIYLFSRELSDVEFRLTKRIENLEKRLNVDEEDNTEENG